jgi:tetratricopeptide (TPR) repeat protein
MANQFNKNKLASSGVSTKVPTTSVNAQGPPSWFRCDWIWGLILILFVILTYTPVWKAGFVWDDSGILTANPCIVGPLGLKEIWTTHAADICPLTLTTFWVEHALWGLDPLPYHLVNVLMQGACAVLLWRVLRSLRVQGAWLGAALWALHPVAVESVAWITEMKNTESGLFFLLSILFFVRWLRAKDLDGRTGGGWNYALSLLCAALAMAAKSSTVILPVVLCLCAWWMEGRWHWRKGGRMVPIFLMAIAASALSIWTQGLQLATVSDPQWVRTWPERLATAGDALWFYIGKLLWPHPLITIYPRWQIDAGGWVSYLPLLAVIVILSIFWLKRELWSRACFFAFAYFMAALLPALGLIDNYIFRFSLVFDHLQYLAGIGPLALAGTGLVRFSNFIIPKKLVLQSSLCAGLLLILGMATWQRTLVYKSEETFWIDALAKNPDCWIGHNNLGNALIQKGRLDEAVDQFLKAVEINPHYAKAYYNLGLALFQKGQLDDAVAQYQKAVEINPNDVEAYYNLGLALFQKGQLDDAVAQYQKAVEINPNYAEAHSNLGNALFQKGQLDEAVDQFQKAVEINPNFAEAHYNLGNTLVQMGHLDEAVNQFLKAAEINPNFAEARYNLGNALFQKGQLDEAVDQFQKALAINPNSFETHYNLGVTLVQKGQLDEAITQFQEVLRLKPDFSPAQDDLDKVQALVRQIDGNK